MRILTAIILLIIGSATRLAAQHEIPHILSMEERAEVIDGWLDHRIDTLLPRLMRKHGIEMWIISAREYNEDPIIETMLPSTWLAARRRTILVVHDRGRAEGVETLAVARYDVGTRFERAWSPDEQPDQWKRLAEIIEQRDPESIAINTSDLFATADGMTKSEFDAFQASIDDKYRGRIISSEMLAAAWLETRTAREMEVYPQIVAIAHAIIAEGLSELVIQPGVTTTQDIQWWYRDRIRDLGLVTWFHPSVDIQRAGTGRGGDFSGTSQSNVVRHGDLLHVDFGITYLRLNTDTQQHAYVLKPGESEAPAGLVAALKIGNRLQDILTDNFVSGRSGNEILAASLARANAEGIWPSIYTHPIGYHGHGTGPTIGLWDQQGGVPGRGDYPLNDSTAYSIELNATVSIPEWDNQDIRIMLEEDAYFDGVDVWYINGRQTSLMLIPRQR